MKRLTPYPIDSALSNVPDFGAPPLNCLHHGIVRVRGLGYLRFRPIQSTDEVEMVRFHDLFSENSINMSYFEYAGLDRRSSHDLRVRMFTNTLESYAVVMERPASPPLSAAILAVGRLAKTEEAFVASFDMLIRKEMKATELSAAFLHRLIKLARAFDFDVLTGDFPDTDVDQMQLCLRSGFSVQRPSHHGLIGVKLYL